MADGNPYPRPSPVMLARMLETHAWSDHLDDQTRKLLEWAHETIDELTLRLGRQASHLERAEARR
jgi:hypothetical protein